MAETNVGQIALDVVLNSKSFTNQLNNSVTNAMKQTASSTAGVIRKTFAGIGGVIGGALAAKGVVDFTKSCLDLGSNLAEVQNVVDVTFGNMSENINEFSKSAMESYGLSETVAKKYAGTFGAMGKAFGFSTSEAVDMSEALTGLTGDVASFYNLSTDESYTKLKSVFTGETESLKDLGVVMTQNSLDQYALQNGFGKTTSAMTDQEKVTLRLAFVQDKLSTASGDFARTSGGWANQIRVLSLRIDSLKATIGQGFINLFTPAIKIMNMFVGKLTQVATAFQSFTSIFGGSQNAIFSQVSDVSDLSSGMGSLADSTACVGDSASKTAKQIQKSLMGFDKLNVLSKKDDSSSSGSSLGSGMSSIDLGSNISTSIPAENVASKFIKDLKDAVDNGAWYTVGFMIGAKLTESLDSINYGDIKSKSEKIAHGIAEFLNGSTDGINWNALGMMLAQGLNIAISFLLSFVLTYDWKNLGNKIGNFLQSSISNINWENLGEALMLKWKILFSLLHGFLDSDFNFVGLGEDIGTAIMGAIGSIAWSQAASDLCTLAIGILNAISSALRTVGWGEVYGTIVEMLSSVDWIGLLSAINECILSSLPITLPILFISATKLLSSFAFNHFSEAIGKVFGEYLENTFIPMALKKIGVIGSKLAGGFSGAFGFISNTLLPGICNAFSSAFAFIAANPIVLVIAAIVALVALIATKGDEIQGILQKVDDFFQNIFAKDFTEIFGPVLGGILNRFMQNIKTIFDGFMKIFNGIIDFIRGVFTGDWERAFKGLKEIVGGTFDAMIGLVKYPINCIIDLINGLITGLNKLDIAVPDWVPGIGGGKIGFDIPKIPKLAQGAYVKANTPQLAMIGDNRHEGEIVAPESKISDAVNNAMMPVVSVLTTLVNEMRNMKQGGDVGDITIPVYLGSDLLDTEIISANDRRNLRTGGR